VLILGAGGATRGIAGPLLAQHPSKLVIANRNLARAEDLIESFRNTAISESVSLSACRMEELREPFDIVIHATSLGLQNATPTVDPVIIGRHTDAYDLGYATQGTPFSRWAQQHGAARTHDGIGLLVEQAAEAFWLWRSVRPETTEVRRLLSQSDERNNP
jgi:shikimate dehydrogenase